MQTHDSSNRMDAYHMSFSSYGDLSSLCWIQNQHVPQSLRESLVEVNVHYGKIDSCQLEAHDPPSSSTPSCRKVVALLMHHVYMHKDWHPKQMTVKEGVVVIDRHFHGLAWKQRS